MNDYTPNLPPGLSAALRKRTLWQELHGIRAFLVAMIALSVAMAGSFIYLAWSAG